MLKNIKPLCSQNSKLAKQSRHLKEFATTTTTRREKLTVENLSLVEVDRTVVCAARYACKRMRKKDVKNVIAVLECVAFNILVLTFMMRLQLFKNKCRKLRNGNFYLHYFIWDLGTRCTIVFSSKFTIT